MFGVFDGLKGLMDLSGLISQACRKVSSQACILISQACKKRSYGSSGSLQAEVVDENILRTTSGSDLVCVPNLLVAGPAVFAKNTNTERQTDIDECYLLH